MKNIFDFFKFQLNEMLKTTLSPDRAEHKIADEIYLLNKDGFKNNDDFLIYFEGKFLIIELKNTYSYDNILSILSVIFSTGYFVSQYFLTSEQVINKVIYDENEFLKYWNPPKYKNQTKFNKNIIRFTLKCEAKWDNDVKINQELYHTTNSENTKNILKCGLLPKSGKKKSYHPERIYFSKDINDVNVVLKILQRNDKRNGVVNSYDILKINTDNLTFKNLNNDIINVAFYDDPNSSGVYTYDKINPNNISLFKENIS